MNLGRERDNGWVASGQTNRLGIGAHGDRLWCAIGPSGTWHALDVCADRAILVGKTIRRIEVGGVGDGESSPAANPRAA